MVSNKQREVGREVAQGELPGFRFFSEFDARKNPKPGLPLDPVRDIVPQLCSQCSAGIINHATRHHYVGHFLLSTIGVLRPGSTESFFPLFLSE